MAEIVYERDKPIDLDRFIELYRASTLADRRPAEDRERMARMRDNANLTISAWEGELLVGIARSLSDFAYVTYVSDLAVRESHQRMGIGRELLRLTREATDCRASIVLLAAPAAADYYRRIGFSQHPRAWQLKAGEPLI